MSLILEQPIYSVNPAGQLRLYVGHHDGVKNEGLLVRRYPKDDEISSQTARLLAERAQKLGKDVRICTAEDAIVFEVKEGMLVFPKGGEELFWKNAGR